jgi:hypothetical protein
MVPSYARVHPCHAAGPTPPGRPRPGPTRAADGRNWSGGRSCLRREAFIEDLAAPGPGGPLPLRHYRLSAESAVLPVVVDFQGGGWTFGDLGSHDRALAKAVEEALHPKPPAATREDVAEVVREQLAPIPTASFSASTALNNCLPRYASAGLVRACVQL